MGVTKRTGRRWPLRRFIVVDRSMEPTLVEGQGLIGVRSRRARVGQLRVVEHPGRAGFWMVKRVDGVVGEGQMTLTSDNSSAPAIDSRQLGPVAVAGSYRVVVRVPRRFMR